MMEEMARHHRTDDGGTLLFAVEHRHAFTSQGGAGPRRHRGAAWVTLLNGEPVRHIETCTFEVIAAGEVLLHHLRCCNCASAVADAARVGDRESTAGQA